MLEEYKVLLITLNLETISKMLNTGNDIDIINELGKVDSEESAKAVFQKYLDNNLLIDKRLGELLLLDKNGTL